MIEWIKDRYHSKASLDYLRYEAKMTKQMIHQEQVDIGHISNKRLKNIAKIYQQMDIVPEKIDLTGIHYSDHTGPAKSK